jgi:hypothetical protein
MTDQHWADRLNQAALAYEDHDGPTIQYPGLTISAALRLQPGPTLAISLRTRDADEPGSPGADDELPAHIPVELLRDDHLVHRDTPAPGSGSSTADPRPTPRPGRRAARRAVVRERAARLGRLLRAWMAPRDHAWEDLLAWYHRVGHAVLVYNVEDAGPTIEYPGLRVFVYLETDGTLAINVWARDVLDDPSLATVDDLPAHIPVELFRDGELLHCDAPTPLDGAA